MAKRTVQRTGLLPGESRKRSLVTVKAAFLTLGSERATGEDERHYVLTTHLLDGRFTYTVEIDGAKWVIPGAVADRMQAHREAIITEQRRLRARERFAQVARSDQQAAEAEADVSDQVRRGL